MTDTVIVWVIIVGALFVTMALAGSLVERLPLSTALLYVAVGAGLAYLGLLNIDPVRHSVSLERLSEVAVVISLFAAGLKLRVGFRDRRWWVPVRLATISMIVTVGLVTLAGVSLLGLPLGAAVLLGAVLAPTDAVLAADVQVQHPGDRDRVRFGLTGEAGLNDGTAFPFVMLGLGLLHIHHIGPSGLRWFGVDVVWATVAGLATGAILGWAVSKLVLYLRRTRREAVGLDDFLGLGLIALSYGVALLLHGYGFLAVFAAGLALRRVEQRETGDEQPEMPVTADPSEVATDPQHAPAFLAHAVLGFTEQIERIGEVAVMVVVGSLLLNHGFTMDALWLGPLLFLVIRPLSVWIGLLGERVTTVQRSLMSWFGIRGAGSVYYLMYAVSHGVEEGTARTLIALTLAVITASVVLHGISVTPLMDWYSGRAERENRRVQRSERRSTTKQEPGL